MLKYLYVREIFSEIPSEITLGISISGCQIHCVGCHSRELWEDKGTPLDIQQLKGLLQQHQGITCLLLLGGESNIDALIELFQYACRHIKTAWYCGLDFIPKDKCGIIQYLDYLKIGHYDQDLGGLDSPSTNQRLYAIEHISNGDYHQTDITPMLQKQQQTSPHNP